MYHGRRRPSGEHIVWLAAMGARGRIPDERLAACLAPDAFQLCHSTTTRRATSPSGGSCQPAMPTHRLTQRNLNREVYPRDREADGQRAVFLWSHSTSRASNIRFLICSKVFAFGQKAAAAPLSCPRVSHLSQYRLFAQLAHRRSAILSSGQ